MQGVDEAIFEVNAGSMTRMRGSSAVGLAGVVAVAVAASAIGLTVPAAAAATIEFNVDTNWQVPQGVSAVRIVAIGGGGGASNPTPPRAVGGSGAIVTSTLAVTPGTVLEIGVGQGGKNDGPISTGATGGGGGGGASLVYQGGVPKVIAGGGGGAGSLAVTSDAFPTANGGNAGFNPNGSGQGGDNGGGGGTGLGDGGIIPAGRGGFAGGVNGSGTATDGGGTALDPGLGGPGGYSGGSASAPNGGAAAAFSGAGGNGSTTAPAGDDPGGSGGGGGGGMGGGGGANGPGGGGAGGSLGPSGTIFSTAGNTGPGAGATFYGDRTEGDGADGRVTITYTVTGSSNSKPGAVVLKVAYPSQGKARGKAVVTWRSAIGATGYQTRVAKTKRKLKKAAWSAVRTTKKQTVSRKPFKQYFEVRAVNAAGTGQSKRATIRRR